MKILSLALLLTCTSLPVASEDEVQTTESSFEATCANWNKPCPASFPAAQCKQDPCLLKKCLKGTKCRPNYCGSCRAVCCGGSVVVDETEEDEEQIITTNGMKDGERICIKKDIRHCPDKSTVVRDPRYDCEFPPCPGEPFACREDSRKCSDGTVVYRNRKKGCMFFPCPETTDEKETEVIGESEGSIVDEEIKDAIVGIEAAEIVGASELFPSDERETDVVGEKAMENEEDQIRRGCFKDFQRCDDGSIVVRDPENDCEFPSCPETTKPASAAESTTEGAQTAWCTKDLRICDDGSSVGRDPLNNCEFEPCPEDEKPDLVSGSTTEEDQVRGCTKDVKYCRDGTIVIRDPLNDCKFAPCRDVSRNCDSDEHVCGDLSTVSRDSEKCCVFYPCPKETMMEKIERKVQEMACEATSFSLRPGRPRSGD